MRFGQFWQLCMLFLYALMSGAFYLTKVADDWKMTWFVSECPTHSQIVMEECILDDEVVEKIERHPTPVEMKARKRRVEKADAERDVLMMLTRMLTLGGAIAGIFITD